MPVTVEWYITHRVIRVRVVGDLTIQDISATNQKLTDFIEQAEEEPVHCLIDRSQVRQAPRSLQKFVETATIVRHPKLGYVIGYGSTNRLIDFVPAITARMAGIKYRKFQTEAEALEFLTQVMSTT